MSVQAAQSAGVTLRWELAERIVGDQTSPKEALQALFDGIMKVMEYSAKTPVSAELKERVWQQISPSRIKTLKDTLILGMSEKVLNEFKDSEIETMLNMHKKNGVLDAYFSMQVKVVFTRFSDSIINKMVETAKGMSQDLNPEIDQIFQREGVQLLGLNQGEESTQS